MMIMVWGLLVTIPSSSGVISKKSCSCWHEKMCEWFLLITECNACSRLVLQPMPEDPKPAKSFRRLQPEDFLSLSRILEVFWNRFTTRPDLGSFELKKNQNYIKIKYQDHVDQVCAPHPLLLPLSPLQIH